MNFAALRKELLIVLFGAAVCLGGSPGSVFTYQGRLIDSNAPGEGLYDLWFSLWDANEGGSQLGWDIKIDDVDLIDGYFTVRLDSAAFLAWAFNGSPRWLQIGVRPAELDDPEPYTVLEPRQEVTPTPYAMYAEKAGSAVGGVTGSGFAGYIPKFIGGGAIGSSVMLQEGDNIGINWLRPDAPLCVSGEFDSVDRIENILEVNRQTSGDAGIGIGAGLVFRNEVSNRGIALASRIACVMENVEKAEGGLLFQTRKDWPLTDAMYLDPEGNAGIGTTDPSARLHVYKGSAGGINPSTIYDPLAIESDNHAYFNIVTPTDKIGGILFSDDRRNRGMVKYDHEYDSMSFSTSALSRVTIDSAGRVGIGTGVPDEELVVGKPLGSGWAVPAVTVGGENGGGFQCGNETYKLSMGCSSTFGRARIICSDDSGFAMGDIEFACAGVVIGATSPAGYALRVNGSAAKPGGGSWSVYSDARLKEVTGEYDAGLDEVCRLDPVRYRYNQDNDMELSADEEHVGLVAQDVLEAIPEAVEENESGYLMVKNDPVIWAMVNSIKELKAENEQLRQRLDALEKSVHSEQRSIVKGVE
ncbi:MAG: tail fiber domain-containing protein [Planctomycetota bacterium]|jgi:hypothetical protein